MERFSNRSVQFHVVLAAFLLVLAALLLWQLAHVFLLLFAAVLFAIILSSLADLIGKALQASRRWTVFAAVLFLVLLAGVFLYLLGAQLREQIMNFIQQLPQYLMTLGERLGVPNLEQRLFERAENLAASNGIVFRIIGYTSSVLGALAGLILVLIAGIFLAFHPHRYRRGVLKLVPPRLAGEALAFLDNTNHALRHWLLGQLVSMAAVGALITLGLFLLGMPSALALGFFAGVAEFVPIVGPVISAVPAILLAFQEGGNMVYWVMGLYLVIQQLESHVIMPLVQRKAVQLPPVLTIFGILAFGVLFGPLGVLLGAPLTVLIFVGIEQFYIRGALGQETTVPGEEGAGGRKARGEQ